MSLPIFKSRISINNISHPLENESYEEEIRIAEEMSFLDEYNLYFDPTRLEETKDRVKMYEDIVDEQLLLLDHKFQSINNQYQNHLGHMMEDDNAPLRDSQIRDLFGFSSSLDSEKMLAGVGGGGGGGSGSIPETVGAVGGGGGGDEAKLPTDSSPVFLERRSASKEQKLKETVDSICRSLRWYQNKIVKQIESTVEEVKLAPLLELNDHLSTVLTKADRIAQNEKENQEIINRKRSKLSAASSSSKISNLASKDDPVPQVDLNSVLNAVYALRRVVEREETLVAVENLISICELEGEVHISAVKHMMNAGALQVLLAVLSRATEWPEVESQISKVVSVLVTYEDDWTLLQRSALVILSSLYTLQLKTQSRARSRSEAVNRLSNSGPPMLEMIEAVSSVSLADFQSYGSERLSITTNISEAEQQNQDIRALVAAAVAKLSLVLSNEWSKQESPFGEFPIPAGASVMPVTNSFQHGLDRVEKMRSLITRHSKSIRPSLNDGNNMDSNRVLQVLLNLILTISEASLFTLDNSDAFEPPLSVSRTPAKFITPGNPSGLSLSVLPTPTLSSSQSDGKDLSILTINAGANSADYNYHRIDQFLMNTFGISFDTLLSGSVVSVRAKLVDNSAVLCSTALVNIAEVPHCRPGLVAGGALRVIRSWLEIGVNILKHAQLICADFISQVTNFAGFQEFFFNLFGPVYELIANATAALMFLVGGSSDNKSNTAYFTPSNPLHAGGGRDYIIGWIDAQILAEGLPDVLVNLVQASHQSFFHISLSNTTAPVLEGASPTTAVVQATTTACRRHQLSPCVLPGQISKNIARFLFQICSRAQNRSRLQGSRIPYVLCTIFEKSVAAVKYTIDHTLGLDSAHPSSADDESEERGASPIVGSSPINAFKLQQVNDFYRKIFEFGMIHSTSEKVSGNAGSSKSNYHQYSNQHYQSITIQNQQRLQQQSSRRGSGKKAVEQIQQHGSNRFFGTFGFSHRSPHAVSTANAPVHEGHSSHHNFKIPTELMEMMSLITAACLDTVGYYFSDEMTHVFPTTGNTAGKPPVSAVPLLDSSTNVNIPLISLMCNQRIIAAILMVTSNLPKGSGRVAAIRIISSLTECQESLLALYEGSIMDALLLISSETEEFGNHNNPNNNNNPSAARISDGASNPHYNSNKKEFNHDAASVSSNNFPAKPSNVERASSNNSTISGISSCNSVSKRSHSFHRISNMFGGRSESHGGMTPITSISHLDDFMDDEELLHQDMALEETLYVCYSLANLCHSNPSYALRMYTSGLLVIMSRLVKSSHPEISHQAVRCMNAMCSVIAMKATSSSDESQAMSPRNNNRAVLRETLDVLTDAIRSNSPLVQKEAVLTIAQLCLVGEEFRGRVMDGCMRSITSISVNPQYPRDLRSAAEEVLKNCGFYSGLKDFESCGFDYEVLKEWYYLKRSLKAQEIGKRLLNLWVERLFTESEPLYGRQSLLFSPSSGINAVTAGFAEEGSNMNELYQFSLAGEIADLLKITAFSWAKPIDSSSLIATTQQTLSGIPHLHRHITDSFFRLLPICFPKFSDSSSSHNNPDNELDGFYPPARGSSMSSHHSRDGYGGNGGPNGGGFTMNRSTYSPAQNPSSSHHQQFDNYSWIDRPPLIVTNMYDMFFSSRIHQLLVMDITSIGVCIPVAAQDRISDLMDEEENETPESEELAFLIPHPHPIYAILLPNRIYQSFSRVGRVLQRMFETADPNQLWALSFRDCEYHGDFHTSLLATLQRCPQICSISFSSSNRVEDDALLGHLVGQIPSTVRFISFRSTLSHESIQALCILLRTHNAAFLATSDFEDLDRIITTPTASSKHTSYRSQPSTSTDSNTAAQYLKNYASPPTVNEYSKTPEKGPAETYAAPVAPPSNKGLLGLALTHLTLDAPEIQHIVELLQPRTHAHLSFKGPKGKGTYATTPPTLSLKRAESQTSTNSSGTPKSNGTIGKIAANAIPFTASLNKLPENPSAPLRGLKYLDLGYNSLGDADCATLFKAAINGPLEGLELGGNLIFKASKFIEALTSISSPKQLTANPNRLRYLGLANNNLSNKAFTGILYKLVENTSLTGLDLSNNGIESTATNNESLRSFLKKNSGLRLLDLSHNKLTTESYRLMHLGLLENSGLLMLPLYGNQNVETSPSVELIQVKLRENRLVYKSQSKDYSYGFTKGDTDYYPTEDVSSRISFSGMMDIPPTVAVSSTPPTDTIAGAATTATITILEGDEDLDQSIDSQIITLSPDHPLVGLMKDASTDPISGDHSRVSSGNNSLSTSGHEAKKQLSIFAPNETKKDDNLAVALPVPSPRVVTHNVSTSTNVPSIPNTPKRSSGKFLAVDLPHNNSGSGNSVSTGTMTANATDETGKSEELAAIVKDIKVAPSLTSFANTLNVLFSAPLAGFDRSGKAHPLEVLDYTSERDTLIQVFKEVHRDIAVHFDFATTDSLRTILSFGCKSLHFSGHGIPKGLCFEDGKSGLQVIREVQLKDLLSAGGLSLEFVFVSACYSKEIGEAFVKAGVGHVVCVKVDSKIPDSAAIAFTRAFYVAFLSGKTVKASFDIAKEALKLSPYVPDSVFEGDKFILIPEVHAKPSATAPSTTINSNGIARPSTPPPSTSTVAVASTSSIITDSKYHEKVLFTNRISIEWPNPGQCTIGPNRTDLKQFLTRIRIPSPPADFEGREVIMNSIIRNILDRRLVSLTGEDGVGKSAVAAAVCKYIADREFFPDGIVYLKCKGYKDFPSFLHGLKHSILHSGNNVVARKMQELLNQHHSANSSTSNSHHTSSSGHHYNSHTSSSISAATTTTSVTTASATSHHASTNQSNHPTATTAAAVSSSTIEEEELIFTCLESMNILLVADHLDDLVSDFGDSVTFFRLFLNRLFEQCSHVKLLNVSTDTLSMSNIYIGSGIVEYSVSLGPLTLNSTLRLFARLAPSLTTIHDKLAFIDSLQPPKQYHVTMSSREISNAALQILALFGEGHPAKIVHMACESTPESVEELKRIGKRMIQQSSINPVDLLMIGQNHNIVITEK